jgi:predicted lipoprotein with Yx(FWY)xxD motif
MKHSQNLFGRQTIYMIAALLLLGSFLLAACQPAEIPVTGATSAPATSEPVAPAASSPSPVQPAATSTPPAGPDPSPESVAAAETELAVANHPEFGEILVGRDGLTLYIFTNDEPNKSNCTGDCLAIWPPLLEEGELQLDSGVDPALISSAEMDDGSRIVTYNSRPLYYWVNDRQPGDATGQGVGGVWFVVSKEGEPVGMETEADISIARDPQYGEILVGKEGMALYVFTVDEPNRSNCTGDCLVNWPPFLAEGESVVGEGIDESLVGTAEMEDDSLIFTYNRRPLYYWAHDREPGDLNGQGVGGVWFVINPEGEPVTEPVQSQQADRQGDDQMGEDDYLDPDY